MAPPFIQVKNLVKNYETVAGPQNVLSNIDFTLQTGEFVALVGPSGSGKTTFLNMLTGVDKPTQGQVQIGDVSITGTPAKKLTKWRAKNVGIVFQLFQLLPTLTVAENIMFPMDFTNTYSSAERRKIALNLLERLGIPEQADKTPDMLSGGQQQRVAIARALANHPPLVIGDEPTANLDRMSAGIVFDLLQELAIQGTTVIITTHDRELVKNVPKILELRDGLINRSSLEAAAVRSTQERAALHPSQLAN
jgi:putative ABC transport system ATP-binding protein